MKDLFFTLVDITSIVVGVLFCATIICESFDFIKDSEHAKTALAYAVSAWVLFCLAIEAWRHLGRFL